MNDLLVIPETFGQELAYFSRFQELVIDTETTGLRPYNGDTLVGISLGAGKRYRYFAFRHPNSPLDERYLHEFIRLLNRPNLTLIGHNIKFDLQMLAKEGMQLPLRIEDTMYAAHLMNENEPSFKLKVLADKYLGTNSSEEDVKLQALLKSRKLGKEAIGSLTADEVVAYASDDVRLTYELLEFYKPYLNKWGLENLFYDGCRYLLALTQLQMYGMLIEVERLQENEEKCEEQLKNLRQAIISDAGRDINLNSPKQLKEWLNLGSTRKQVLMNLVNPSPSIQMLITYRNFAKQINTYYEPFKRFMDQDNILHPELNFHTVVTGRLSSQDPNLLAIPRTGENTAVKEVFIARPGTILLSCDYKQVEMRVLAHLSHEQRMIDLLNAGEDIHDGTAKLLHVDRNIGKTINFGVVYGIGADKLSKMLQVQKSAAQQFLRGYDSLYPNFNRHSEQIMRMARNYGYIRLWTNRIRHFNGKCRKCFDPGCRGEHTAMSSEIQGSAAEVSRIALTRIHEWFYKYGVRILLQIHDEILMEVPEDKLRMLAPDIMNAMEDFHFNPRLMVDAKVGYRWGEMLKLERK